MAPPKKSPEDAKKDEYQSIVDAKNQFTGIDWITPGMGWEINFKGLYSHEALLKTIAAFLEANGYGSIPTKNTPGGVQKDGDRWETYYEDKNVNGWREIRHRWRAKKVKSDRADYYIYWNCILFGVGKQEIMYQNQKIKLENVEIDCWLKGGIVMKNPLLEKGKAPPVVESVFGKDGKKLFEKYYDPETSMLKKELREELLSLHDQMKRILGIPTTQDIRQFMFARKGLPMLSTDAPDWKPNPEA